MDSLDLIITDSTNNTSRLLTEDNEVTNSSLNHLVLNQNVNKPQCKRSSRTSILLSMDPFYTSVDVVNSHEIQPVKEEEEIFQDSKKSDLNQSVDLLNFDVSMTNIDDDNCNEQKTPTKNYEFDMFQHQDFDLSTKNSSQSESLSNISQILNESISEDKENIAIDNLIGLSPVKQSISKSTFDKLKKYHNEKKVEWMESEKKFQTHISEMKIEFDSKINDLLSENEENLEKMKESHRLSIRERDADREKLLMEVENLRAENTFREAVYMRQLLAIDDYEQTIDKLIGGEEEVRAGLQDDVHKLEACLESYVQKIGKYKEVIQKLSSNQEALVAEVDKNKKCVAELTASIQQTEKELTETKQGSTIELSRLKSHYDMKSRRLEVKILHLENVEKNMRTELQLRETERDQLKENLQALLNEEY